MTHWVGVVSNCTVWTVFWTLSLFLLLLSKLPRQHSEFVLVSSPTVQLDIKGAFHFPRNSANSGWDVNGTHVFQAFQWKVARNKWNFEKVVLFSRWKLSGGNEWSIYEFSQGITSSRLCRAKSVPANLNFGDESIDGWNWRQIEHVLHSMDLSMEVSESFW